MTEPANVGALRAASFALAALLLSGCTTTRYVTVHCVTKEQASDLKSKKPAKVGSQLTGEADKDIRPIAGRLVRMEAYADGLMGVIEGCAGEDVGR